MIESSQILLRAFADDLADRISPSHWDLSIADAVASLAGLVGDLVLADALRPVAPLLEATSSAAALDLAYASPATPTNMVQVCELLATEIETEWGWLEDHAHSWAADDDEVLQVIAEFEALITALVRLARAVS